jgi:uncharacterized membrane protein
VSRSQQIYQLAVLTSTMPYGNVTAMTQTERDTLGAWVQAGAPGP